MDSLLLIDALNLIRRVYEANRAPDSPEKFRAAKKAIEASVSRALREHPSERCAAVFDVEGETWRHQLYPGFKADRKPMPPNLRAGLSSLKEAFQLNGLTVIAEPGVDADDIMASLATQAKIKYPNVKIKVLSTDKDMLQLLPEGVRVFDHFARTERTPEWVTEKFGVKVEAFRDFQALMGDAVDGIPGLPRVGVRTAADWLNRFGSVEAMLEKLDSLEPTIRSRVEAGREDLELSLRLVTLLRTVQVEL